ncbi:MAG: hypothetical protein IPO21_00545 [Bacteroidales bacterium]|nr:hypothetical protein [Bacteroidales bacterium]
MIEEIAKLLEGRNLLAKQAYEQYKPLVNNIIASQNKDVNHICYTLDFMLDFCFDNQMLQLFRCLCRYLHGLDANAAISYVNAYREMWDEEGVKFGNKKMEEKV